MLYQFLYLFLSPSPRPFSTFNPLEGAKGLHHDHYDINGRRLRHRIQQRHNTLLRLQQLSQPPPVLRVFTEPRCEMSPLPQSLSTSVPRSLTQSLTNSMMDMYLVEMHAAQGFLFCRKRCIFLRSKNIQTSTRVQHKG